MRSAWWDIKESECCVCCSQLCFFLIAPYDDKKQKQVCVLELFGIAKNLSPRLQWWVLGKKERKKIYNQRRDDC